MLGASSGGSDPETGDLGRRHRYTRPREHERSSSNSKSSNASCALRRPKLRPLWGYRYVRDRSHRNIREALGRASTEHSAACVLYRWMCKLLYRCWSWCQVRCLQLGKGPSGTVWSLNAECESVASCRRAVHAWLLFTLHTYVVLTSHSGWVGDHRNRQICDCGWGSWCWVSVITVLVIGLVVWAVTLTKEIHVEALGISIPKQRGCVSLSYYLTRVSPKCNASKKRSVL